MLHLVPIFTESNNLKTSTYLIISKVSAMTVRLNQLKPESRERLVAKLLRQPSENETPFELGVLNKKHCDSKQKAHRRKRRWACFER